jgi:RND family efflux transporter MFP subunit
MLLAATACAAPPPSLTEPDPTEAQARIPAPPAAAPEFVAVVTSRRSSVISAQVGARIEKLAIHAGQLVKAGELVARLDETELKNQLDQARANEDSARLEAGSFGAEASAAHQKMIAETRLHKLGVASAMEVSSARAEYAKVGSQGSAALAKATSARAEREQRERNLAKAEIYSPLDGIVTNIKAHEGEVAQPGMQLARVFDPSDLILRFAVPRDQRARLALGERVELSVDGGQRPVWATVTNISGAQEPPINFIVVEADIDDAKLVPGELTVASVGRVRIADVRGAKR